MMSPLEQFLREMEELSNRAEAAGLHILSSALMLDVRIARQFKRKTWTRLLTIVCTAVELCERSK